MVFSCDSSYIILLYEKKKIYSWDGECSQSSCVHYKSVISHFMAIFDL